MRLGIALGFGWVCGGLSEAYLDFLPGLTFALIAGLSFGAVVVLVDRYTDSEPNS